jgi:guanylate kinase
MLGVILFGPPTSGKDTITAVLTRLDNRFQLLPRLKVGTGRTHGYRLTTQAELNQLHEKGRLIIETRRYGNVYAVDRDEVTAIITSGSIPVVHIGSLDDVEHFCNAFDQPWLKVMLWISRQECARRSQLRGDVDTSERLRVWDQVLVQAQRASACRLFDSVIRTDQRGATGAAADILEAWRENRRTDPHSCC